GLLSDQATPDGVALGPEVLAFVVEARGVAVDHDAERHGVDPRHDAAVELRCTAVHCDRVALLRVADLTHAVVEEHAQDASLVVRSAAHDEVVGHLAPALLEPGNVRLESAGGGHERLCPHLDALAALARDRAAEAAVAQLEVLDLGIVGDGDAEMLRRAVVRVDERLAAAEEERVGAAQVEGARERRLEPHAVLGHPGAQIRRSADGEPGERLVRLPAGDAPEVVPEFLLQVLPRHDCVRASVDVAQVARMAAVAAAKIPRSGLEDQHARAGFPRRDGRAQPRIAAAGHQDVRSEAPEVRRGQGASTHAGPLGPEAAPRQAQRAMRTMSRSRMTYTASASARGLW